MSLKLAQSSNSPIVWCAIPVYNNAGTIAQVAANAIAFVQRVLVIDDGSTDADLRELLKGIEVEVIRHPVNRGKGAALLTALEAAKQGGAEFLITLDGDGQHDPREIEKFIPELSRTAIVIGRRDTIVGKMPNRSRFGRDFSDFWVGVETGFEVSDTQSGFRPYPVWPILQLPLTTQHYNFEIEILTRALWAGLHIRSVPISVFYPPREQRVSSFDPFMDNLRLARVHTRLALRELLPWPHRQIIPAADRADPLSLRPGESSWAQGIRSPMGLSASVFVASMFGIILWPLGPIATLFVAGRLHLNKAAALVVIALTTLPIVPKVCLETAQEIMGSSGSPRLRWIVGAHAVAFVVAPVLTLVTYFLAKIAWPKA